MSLNGWIGLVPIPINAGVGVPTANFQMVGLQVFYGSGTAAAGKVYLGGACKPDFSDLRLADINGNLYKINRRNVVGGSSCLLDCLVTQNLNYAATVYLYYGNPAASAVDDTTLYVDYVTGVVGAWNFEDGAVGQTGVAAQDYSGNGNNGAATGTTVVASPFFAGKNARQFNGQTDGITVSDSASLDSPSNAVSLVAWVYVYAAPVVHTELIWKSSYVLQGADPSAGGVAGAFWFYTSTNNGTHTMVSCFNAISLNAPHCLIAVYNKDGGVTSQKIYLDGVLQSQATVVGTLDSPAGQPLYLGGVGGSGLTLNGVMGVPLVVNGDVSSQVSDLSALTHYPDVTLVPGVICVRQYASAAQPSWGTPGSPVVVGWSISTASSLVILPANPQAVTDENPVIETDFQVDGQQSVVISEGLDVRTLTLKGFFYAPGQSKVNLDAFFVSPLLGMNRQVVTVNSPTPRYNGSWVIVVKSVEEKAEGQLQRYTYTLVFKQGASFVVM